MVAWFLIFVLPAFIPLMRYEKEQVVSPASTSESYGFAVTFLVSMVGIVAAIFLVKNFMEVIKKHPFGTLATMTYGFVMLAVIWFVWHWTRTISKSVEMSMDGFVEAANYHAETMETMMYSVGTGVLIVLLVQLSKLFK